MRISIEKMKSLEKDGKWMEICELAQALWIENDKSLEATLGVLAEYWILMMDDAFYGIDIDISLEMWKQFWEVFLYGEEHYKDQPDYLWITGYILNFSLLNAEIEKRHTGAWCPFSFDEASCEKNREEAKKRLLDAYEKRPGIMIWRTYQKFFEQKESIKEKIAGGMKRLCQTKEQRVEESKRVEQERKLLEKEVWEYFPGDGEVDEYFRESLLQEGENHG